MLTVITNNYQQGPGSFSEMYPYSDAHMVAEVHGDKTWGGGYFKYPIPPSVFTGKGSLPLFCVSIDRFKPLKSGSVKI